MTTGWAQLAAGLLIGAGLFFLGLYVGLGLREDREADRAARVAMARVAALATRPTVYLMAPPAPPSLFPFPRAGLLPVDLGQLAGAEVQAPAPELPHGPASRPATSLVDLDGAVRLMCIEAEQYVANLLAATYHAERGHPW